MISANYTLYKHLIKNIKKHLHGPRITESWKQMGIVGELLSIKGMGYLVTLFSCSAVATLLALVLGLSPQSTTLHINRYTNKIETFLGCPF